MATQIALLAFLTSVASSSDLVRQLLPPRLNSTNGVNDLLFTSVVDEWVVQTAQNDHSRFVINQKAREAPLVAIDRERVLSAASNRAGIARLTATTAPYSATFCSRHWIRRHVFTDRDCCTTRCASLCTTHLH